MTVAALEIRLARLEETCEEQSQIIADLQGRVTELELSATGSGSSVEYDFDYEY